jgi:Amt family ammonium transporter
LANKLKLDDPAEAFIIHGPCGIWGIIATAFFHTDEGIFYGYNAKVLGIQIVGILGYGLYRDSLVAY